MGEERKYTPVKKYAFPAGDCGGEIRVTIPLFAKQSDLRQMADMLSVLAESWSDPEQDEQYM